VAEAENHRSLVWVVHISGTWTMSWRDDDDDDDGEPILSAICEEGAIWTEAAAAEEEAGQIRFSALCHVRRGL